jgi:hypothetical protein
MCTQRAFSYLGLVLCLILSTGAEGQDVSFREPGHPRTEYPVGPSPRNGIATGDFNNDGTPDVVVANSFQNTVSLLLATPDGSSFQPARTFQAFLGSGNATQIAVGDVNNDGNLDIVAVSNFGGIVSLLLGNGDGTFRGPTNVPGFFGSSSFVALVDFNGDNKLDLAVSSDSGTLYVALGNGDGTFQAPRSTTVGSPAGAMANGDFNGDGRMDLVITVSSSLVLLLGNGDGTFAPPRSLSVPSARIPVAADFNGDHKLDLAVLQGSSVSILLGNGDGSFQGPRTASVGPNSFDIKAGDMNSDGSADVVVTFCTTSFGSVGSVGVLLGNGDGTLQAPSSSGTSGCAAGVALADFDRDGNLDVVANKPDSGATTLLPGNGDGTIGPMRPSVGASPYALAVGDFNEDGLLDLAVANNGSNTVSLLFGNGVGTFQRAQNVPVGIRPVSVAVGDFANRGHKDLAVANSGSADVSVLRGRGDGTFIPLGAVIIGSAALAVLVGDFNGDGKDDIAALKDFSVAMLLGNGNGTFQAPISSSTGVSGGSSFAMADLNGDGIQDLVVTGSFSSNNISVLLGIGNGSFQSPRMLATGASASSVAIGDLNGDGVPDLAVANSSSSNVSVFLGNGNGTFQPGVDFFVLASGPSSVVIQDFNGDGRFDIAVANGQSNNFSVLLNIEVTNAAVLSPVSFIDVGEFPAGSSPRFLAAGNFCVGLLPDLAVVNSVSNDVAVLINSTM